MLTFDYKTQPTRREKMLEMYIEKLQERVCELEQKSLSANSWQSATKTYASKFVVIPVVYTSGREQSPRLEIVPYPPICPNHTTLPPAEQLKRRVYETVV